LPQIKGLTQIQESSKSLNLWQKKSGPQSASRLQNFKSKVSSLKSKVSSPKS